MNYKQGDYAGQTVLMRSSNLGDEKMVALLCASAAQVNRQGGALDVNMGDDEGATALHYAAKAAHPSVVHPSSLIQHSQSFISWSTCPSG